MPDPFAALGDLDSRATAQAENTMSEHEYATHICRMLDRRLSRERDLDFDLEHGGQRIVAVRLRDFFWLRSVDAMEWVLHCAVGDRDFDQEIDDEIPILRKFYNEFIGQDQWTEDDHTMMTVLNRHDFIKDRGYGNFARQVEEGAAIRAAILSSPVI